MHFQPWPTNPSGHARIKNRPTSSSTTSEYIYPAIQNKPTQKFAPTESALATPRRPQIGWKRPRLPNQNNNDDQAEQPSGNDVSIRVLRLRREPGCGMWRAGEKKSSHVGMGLFHQLRNQATHNRSEIQEWAGACRNEAF